MILVVCLDENNGLMFNKRRQSRDRVLISDLLCTAGEGTVCISPYSAPLFPEADRRVRVCNEPHLAAVEGELCFCEDFDPRLCADRIEGLIIYRWNRLYPSDVRFELDLSDFRLVDTQSFTGSSHDMITKEILKNERKEKH